MLIEMISGPGWETASGKIFSKDHPFQIINDFFEIQDLLNSGRFREASRDDLIKFYQYDKID